MRGCLSFVVLTFIFISCTKDKPRWLYDDVENFKPDKVELGSCTIRGLKLVTTRENLLGIWGQPTSVIEDAGTFFGKDISNKQINDSTMFYSAFYYGPLRFAVWSNNATIETIDFRNSDTEMKSLNFSLSSNTQLDYIKEKFVRSYSWRNIGINKAEGILFDLSDKEKGNLTWIHLENENGQIIELTFVDNKLAFLINTIVD